MKKIINKFKKKIYIYNTLKHKKEIFKPIKKNKIGMYVCGPTLYKKIHLGNCRTFIMFDIFFRYFKHLKYKIKYIRNITDINNNYIKNKKKINLFNYIKLNKKNYIFFKKNNKKLNLLSPNLEPKTTCHIIEQIDNINKILKKKKAYNIKGSIYFNINKFNKKNKKYGFLINKIDIKKLKYNKSTYKKKNFYDFALWKKKNKIKWYSPWSYGLPGWHIGCTTMSTKYLGKYFDIHGGGLDLKFPHHECEIAQNNVINNNNMAKYWIHVNMLNINNKKMSKSLNNFIYLDKFKKINPLIIKLYFLQTHYRKIINFSFKSLKKTSKIYYYLINYFNRIKKIKLYKKSNINIKKLYYNCYYAINDDFNIPLLIFNLIKINKIIDLCIIKKKKNK
ncbi:MAG: cysteine--tRNA ligase [Candidatus Shikimatogenerans bostrichidophilus]|nr:MAG: cysteine--tRNA ligase [Candidatus Shikimatogenerans bostrichidophilus]